MSQMLFKCVKGGGILYRVIGMQIKNDDYSKDASVLTLFGCEIILQVCNNLLLFLSA